MIDISDEAVQHGDLDELLHLLLDEVELAIDLVEGARVAGLGVVRSVTDLLEGGPGLPYAGIAALFFLCGFFGSFICGVILSLRLFNSFFLGFFSLFFLLNFSFFRLFLLDFFFGFFFSNLFLNFLSLFFLDLFFFLLLDFLGFFRLLNLSFFLLYFFSLFLLNLFFFDFFNDFFDLLSFYLNEDLVGSVILTLLARGLSITPRVAYTSLIVVSGDCRVLGHPRDKLTGALFGPVFVEEHGDV